MRTDMMRILQIIVTCAVLNQAFTKPYGQETYETAFDERSCYYEADLLADNSNRMTRNKESKDDLYFQDEQMGDDGYVAPQLSLTDNTKLWQGGHVPYIIDFDPTDNQYVYFNILRALDIINETGCIKFYEKTNETDVLRIRLGSDFSSHLGRQSGIQDLTVAEDVSNPGTVIHELMHTLGFGHEHNRPDRDEYIVVHWDNIKEEAKPYFKKYTDADMFTNNNLTYDPRSIMHATTQANENIAIDLTKPVITRIGGGTDLGQRAGLTELDIERIKVTYNCGICASAPAKSLFVYPGDCSKYYQCVHGEAVAMNCNEDLHFSLSFGYCDYPSVAGCAY